MQNTLGFTKLGWDRNVVINTVFMLEKYILFSCYLIPDYKKSDPFKHARKALDSVLTELSFFIPLLIEVV